MRAGPAGGMLAHRAGTAPAPERPGEGRCSWSAEKPCSTCSPPATRPPAWRWTPASAARRSTSPSGLARLAQPVCFLSQVSRGFLGERLMRALARRRREHGDGAALRRADHAQPDRPGCAGRALVLVLRRGLRRPAADARRAGRPAGGRAGRSTSAPTPPWSGATAATQRALVEREQGRTLIAYDPNIRLNVEPALDVWRDADRLDAAAHAAAQGQRRGPAPGAGPASRRRTSPRARWRRASKLVVVTRGGEGASAWTATAQRRRAAGAGEGGRHRRRRRHLPGRAADLAGRARRAVGAPRWPR